MAKRTLIFLMNKEGLSINNNLNSIEVTVDTLDSYADKNNISKIDALKIDTEGADTWALLYGVEKLLKENED